MAVTDEAILKIKDMIMQGELGPGSRLPPEKELSERLGLSLGDARGGLVEEDDGGAVGEQAGEVDDAAGAGGQLPHEGGAVATQLEQLEQLVDPGRHLALGVEGAGEVEGG